MTKIKICGITNIEDARVAVAAGADLLGFIFYKRSPRYVAPQTVREIVACLKRQAVATTENLLRPLPQFVGVFVNAERGFVARTLTGCRLDAAQLHGEEPPEFVAHFRGRAYKALRPPSPAEAETQIEAYRSTFPAGPAATPCFLLDAYHPALYGGTGRVTDWTMAANIARRYPIMLAGSLTPANVAGAIQAVRPWGVDVSSGVEREKGRKDHDKLRAFIEAVNHVNFQD